MFSNSLEKYEGGELEEQNFKTNKTINSINFYVFYYEVKYNSQLQITTKEKRI